MNSCSNCFEDEIILNYIASEGIDKQSCSYCGITNTKVVSIYNLYELYFKKLLKYYHKSEHGFDYHYDLDDPSDYGDSLFELVQQDWSVFPDGSDDTLFFDIMDYGWDSESDGNLDGNVGFSRLSSAMDYIDGSDLWNSFSYSLINENRFFPSENLHHSISKDDLLDEIKNVIKKYTYSLNKGTGVYRARKGNYIENDELKAPKKELVLKGGRSNPAGISVLYAAFTVETAISEVRPHKGEEVTVATASTNENLTLIDLSNIQHMKSPFQFEDITYELGSRNLLFNLQETLSKPIDPNKSEVGYVPSQYLTEYLKSLGYEGLIFKSSLGKSDNLVIFDPSNISIDELNYYDVSDIVIEFKKR